MKNLFDKFPDSYIETSRRMIQTPSAVARSAFFYVQETGYFKLRESHRAFRKNLDSFLFVMVLSGSGTLMYGNKSYPLHTGSCFFINCMTPYYHQSSSTDPWELIWVHFHGATSKEYYEYFSSLSQPAWTPKAFQDLKDKMDRLLDVNEHADLSAEIASSRLIMDILSIILEDIKCSSEVTTPTHQKMLEIRNYLDAHYTEKFSLDDLSENFFLSKYHLCREFKESFGVSPNQYVIAKRITMAKKLLRFSDMNLDEISEKCGFYDKSYLNKQFKNSEGQTASEFRRKWTN